MGNRGGKAKRSCEETAATAAATAATRAEAAEAASSEKKPPPPTSTSPPPPPLCPLTRLDEVAASLQRCGVGCVRVDASAETLHARCFTVAKGAMRHCATADASHPLTISPDTDSAHATGIHSAGALSAYNATREGFIFSNGATFGLPADGSDPAAAAEFESAMGDMFHSALSVATATLAALERRMQLPPGWFEREFGPVAENSQAGARGTHTFAFVHLMYSSCTQSPLNSSSLLSSFSISCA